MTGVQTCALPIFKDFQQISSEPEPETPDERIGEIRTKLTIAQQEADSVVRKRLARSGYFAVVGAENTEEPLRSLKLLTEDTPEQTALTPLHEVTGAEFVLRYRISDYGSTPNNIERWIEIATGT